MLGAFVAGGLGVGGDLVVVVVGGAVVVVVLVVVVGGLVVVVVVVVVPGCTTSGAGEVVKGAVCLVDSSASRSNVLGLTFG